MNKNIVSLAVLFLVLVTFVSWGATTLFAQEPTLKP